MMKLEHSKKRQEKSCNSETTTSMLSSHNTHHRNKASMTTFNNHDDSPPFLLSRRRKRIRIRHEIQRSFVFLGFVLILLLLLASVVTSFLWKSHQLSFFHAANRGQIIQQQQQHANRRIHMVLRMGNKSQQQKTNQQRNNPNASFGQSQSREIFLPDKNTPKQITSDVAPVYITVGPPCGGKTQALMECIARDGYDPECIISSTKDVALDEQSNVYYRIPVAAFMFPSTRLDAKLGDIVLPSGSTLRDRLLYPSPTRLEVSDMELRNIILRVAGRMTPQEFAKRTRDQALHAGDTVKFFQQRRIQVSEDLIQAVEQISVQSVGEVLFQMHQQQQQQELNNDEEENDDLPYDDNDDDEKEEPKLDLSTINATSAQLLPARSLIKTPYVDIFVPHAIFYGGLDEAEEQLHQLLSDDPYSPVSWGNTNTRPNEYVAALSAAQRAGRPVKFVAWGSHNLPKVSRAEILRRTLSKFRNTGRFIPAGAIAASLDRVEKLIREAEKEMVDLFGDDDREGDTNEIDKLVDPIAAKQNEHQMNVALASLAGFAMDDDGFVTKIGDPKKSKGEKKWKSDEIITNGKKRPSRGPLSKAR